MNTAAVIRQVREAVPGITDPRIDISDDRQMCWFVCYREAKAQCVAVDCATWSPYIGYSQRIPKTDAEIAHDIIRGLE